MPFSSGRSVRAPASKATRTVTARVPSRPTRCSGRPLASVDEEIVGMRTTVPLRVQEPLQHEYVAPALGYRSPRMAAVPVHAGSSKSAGARNRQPVAPPARSAALPPDPAQRHRVPQRRQGVHRAATSASTARRSTSAAASSSSSSAPPARASRRSCACSSRSASRPAARSASPAATSRR